MTTINNSIKHMTLRAIIWKAPVSSFGGLNLDNKAAWNEMVPIGTKIHHVKFEYLPIRLVELSMWQHLFQSQTP